MAARRVGMNLQHKPNDTLNFILAEMKVGDWMVFILFFILSLSSFMLFYSGNNTAKYFKIITRGREYGTFSLMDDRVICVDGLIGEVKLEVSGGEVSILSSPCKNKICQKMGHIKKKNEIIVCIPSEVVIEIVDSGEESKEDNSFDGISR